MAVRGGKVGSVKKLRSGLKSGNGGAAYTKRVPKDGSIVVRFITEPDEWVMFYQHSLDQGGGKWDIFPCSDDCKGCDEGDKPSQRYLANVLDVDDNKVVPMELPKSLASSLLKKYDKFKTMIDRDYELSRTGVGLDTEYDAIPEAPTKININRYEPIDLWKTIESQLPGAEEDDDEEEEETKPTKSTRTRPAPKSATTARKLPPKKTLAKKSSVSAKRKPLSRNK